MASFSSNLLYIHVHWYKSISAFNWIFIFMLSNVCYFSYEKLSVHRDCSMFIHFNFNSNFFLSIFSFLKLTQWICLFIYLFTFICVAFNRTGYVVAGVNSFAIVNFWLKFIRSTRMPSMYAAAEDDGLAEDYGRCTDARCGTRTLGGQSTSHFISEGFVQYSQPSFNVNGMVELYQSSASINMCS